MEIETNSPSETLSVGKKIASRLPHGSVLSLNGPLGSGKTILSKSIIANMLSIPMDKISSPAYSLVNEYSSNDKKDIVFHMDFYRLDSLSPDDEEMFLEYFDNDFQLCVVEWGEKILPSLRVPRIIFDISYDFKDDAEWRLIKISQDNNIETYKKICAELGSK